MKQALCAALLFAACDAPSSERWLALAYRNHADLTVYETVGEYPNVNDCLAAARSAAGPAGTYECGLNCTQRAEGLNVCERTVGNER